MKKIFNQVILSITLFLFIGEVRSQTISWGSVLGKEFLLDKSFDYLGDNEISYFYTFESTKKQILLSINKKDLSILYSRPIDLKTKKKIQFLPVDFNQVSGNKITLYYQLDTKLFVREIDATTGSVIEEINTNNHVVELKDEKNFIGRDFSIVKLVSNDLLFIQIFYNSNYDIVQKFYLMNNKFELLAENEMKSSTKSIYSDFDKRGNLYSIDNEDNNILKLTMYVADKNFKSWEENIELSKLDFNNTIHIEGVSSVETKDGKIRFVLLYQEDYEYKEGAGKAKKDKKLKGYITFTIDENNYIKDLKRVEFGDAVMKAIEAYERKPDYLQPKWIFKHYSLENNESAIVLENLPPNGTYTYIVRELIIVKLAANGDFVRDKVIYKKQEAREFKVSYEVISQNGKFFIIWNDTEENKTRKYPDTKVYRGKNTWLRGYFFSDNKLFKHNEINRNNEGISLYRPIGCVKSTDCPLLFGNDKNGYYLGVIRE